jgi:hypothetical protein
MLRVVMLIVMAPKLAKDISLLLLLWSSLLLLLLLLWSSLLLLLHFFVVRIHERMRKNIAALNSY